MQRIFLAKVCLLIGLAGLSACGGGSITPPPPTPESITSESSQNTQNTGTGTGTGTGSTSTTNLPETSFATSCGITTEVLFARSEQAKANANVELIALACGAAISSPQWEQTAGDTVSFLSGRSQAISFLPTSSGMREFKFSYKNALGISQARTVRINVAAATDLVAAAVIRGEPSVWPASATSLRVWLPGISSTALVNASYNWTLLDLKASKLENMSSPNAIITPTTVTNDTVVRVQADVQLADGRKWTQRFHLLVQKPDATAIKPAFDDAAQVYPYIATNNPYADTLKKCVYARSIAFYYESICKLSTLPLLGQTAVGTIPTVEEVMQRVLVSNDWMGQNFQTFLKFHDQSGQIRRMLGSTTAVVIGGRVRPSFYWALTGAIYLDADNLWLTPEERDTISERPDYRGAYSEPFSFELSYWYYKPMQGNDTPYISIESRQGRSLLAKPKDLLSLMVHELTHAADSIPPSLTPLINLDTYVVDVSYELNQQKINATSILGEKYPLSCRDCFDLGAVIYRGAPPTSAQKALSAARVAQLFAADNANDFYAYSVNNPASAIISPEDTAMLAEEALMQLIYGFRRYTYVLNHINGNYSFQWGQASRIGTPAIRQRAGLVLTNTAPWFDQNQLTKLESPTQLTGGSNGAASTLKASEPNDFAQINLQSQIKRQMQEHALRMQFKAQATKRVNAMRAAGRHNAN